MVHPFGYVLKGGWDRQPAVLQSKHIQANPESKQNHCDHMDQVGAGLARCSSPLAQRQANGTGRGRKLRPLKLGLRANACVLANQSRAVFCPYQAPV